MEQEQLLANFQTLNRTRIERLQELAPKNQSLYFDLLALIFHTNSPILPKLTNDNTPAGISDYQPSKAQLEQAKELNPSFKTKLRALRHYPIVGLYLINNNGLLNYPEQPQFELWLVHSDDLNTEQQLHLQDKLSIFSDWSNSLGIITSTRLLSNNALQQKALPNDDLDRFYLNGAVIAGAMPLWWLIPNDVDYQTSADQLLKQRIQQSILIDFGEVTNSTSSQLLIDDSIKLLSQGLEKGLTPILSLAYQQKKFLEYPSVSWLSNELKTAFHQGEVDPLNLDIKLLQLKELESSNISIESLKLVKQSFYVQAKERLSQKVSQPKHPWRRALIKKLCQAWQWQNNDFMLLDHRHESHYNQCSDEHIRTLATFQQVNNLLVSFAKEQSLKLPSHHLFIEKRLQQFTDKKADTIEQLPTGLLPKRHEEHLFLHRFAANADWKISALNLTSDSQIPLHQNASLVHLLAWAVNNKLLSNNSRIVVTDSSQTISISTVKPLIKQLLGSSLTTVNNPSTKTFSQAPQLEHVLLFANLERQAMAKLDQQGLKLSSFQNDPLNYANRGESLITSIDGLIYSSWGEWQTFSCSGTTSPLKMLTTLIPWWNAKHKKVGLQCWCPSDIYGRIINSCLENIYTDVNSHYRKNPEDGNYLLVVAKNLYQLQWQSGSYDYAPVSHTADIYAALSKKRQHFSASMIDPQLDSTHLFASLLAHQSNSQITLFIHRNNNQTLSLYLLDDYGCLFLQHHNNLNETTLINQFYRFFDSVNKKKQDIKLQFFRVKNINQTEWKMEALPLPSSLEKIDYLPVIIIMDSPNDKASCTIKCGNKHFSGISNDPMLFKQVSDFLISLRKSSSRYPLYITELNFTQASPTNTRDYIMQKQRLEKLLNNS